MEVINVLLITASKRLANQIKKRFENHQAIKIKTSSQFNYGYDLYLVDGLQKENIEAIYLLTHLEETKKLIPGDFIFKPVNLDILELLIYQKYIFQKRCLEEMDVILKSLGLSNHLKGYEYLKAVICIMKRKKYHFLKEAYKEVGIRFKVSPSAIEKGIRAAISSGWLHANYNTVDKIFFNSLSYSSVRPTNKQFIYSILNFL